jgi:iron(III) transport system ATP-binding protein
VTQAIAIRGLTKSYGDQVAVSALDLDVATGEVIALLGPSGCGKTTTLQLLAGFLQPDAGEIRIGDRVVSTPSRVIPPERRNLSLIFQSYAVWPHKTVFENVAFGLHVRRVANRDIRERGMRILEVVRMSHLAERYPAELSGGQQQRVALARALVVEPEILLLDEPLSNLDANLREEMRFEIRRLHDTTGITMVYVTHDQSEAMVIADRIAVMNLGRIEQVGMPAEIYERPSTRFVAAFIGRTNTLHGRVVGAGLVDALGQRLQVVDETGADAGSEVAVCVRPHQVVLAREDGSGPNRLRGRIVRAAYLGEFRDYVVEVAGGERLRVSAPPDDAHGVGEEVMVILPADACRVVRG